MCWSALSAGFGDSVEVIGGEGPGEVSIQVERAFHLLEGLGDGRVVGVMAFRFDGCALVVVHVLLDARHGAPVPAPVIRSNDWTRSFGGAAVAASTGRFERARAAHL
jgi:hypothetical protein